MGKLSRILALTAAILLLCFTFTASAKISPPTLPVVPSPTASCVLSPSSISVGLNTNTYVSPRCFVDTEEVPCPGLSWSATIGSISGGPFSVTYNSGNTAGTGTLSASGSGFSCSTPITISSGEQPPPPPGDEIPIPPSGSGSTGGSSSGNGGGAFRTSTSITSTCAGKPATIKITYIVASAPPATVDILFLGGKTQKVFSQTISKSSNLSFTPASAGSYELHVTLGTDQATSSFSVSDCTPETENVSHQATVQLQESRELLLSKTVDYSGGFSKEYKVYRITGGDSESYATEITLYYSYTGKEGSSLSITDSVPGSVISSSGQIAFESYPDRFDSLQDISFTWKAKPSAGQTLRFVYSFPRLVTEQMIAKFAAPTADATQQPTPLIGIPEGQSTESGLFASLFTLGGVAIPLIAIIAGVAAIAMGLFVYMFILGKKGTS